MVVKIVTDSTCDLPTEILASHDITMISCYINMDGKSYLDAVDLGRDEFYKRLPVSKSHVTTSAPGTGTFLKAYTRLLEEGADEILSIHISAKLSNVVNVARLAAAELGQRVHVLDAGQLTIGTGLQVWEAARAASSGLSVTKIRERVKQLGKRVHTIAVGDTLEYLKRSGRLSNFAALLGTLLQVKPLLAMHRDTIQMERTRTRQRAREWLLDRACALGPLQQVVMVHTYALSDAQALRAQVQNLYPHLPTPMIVGVTPVLGAHLGPGVIGLTCVTANSS
jgi:DegV family protein with EDD domain